MWCTACCAVAAAVGVAVVAAAVWATQRVPRWDFTSSTVLLTGGSVGIGFETAKCLVQRRVKYLVIAARREQVLREAVAALDDERHRCGSPTRVHYVVMDVSDEASVKAGLERVRVLCEGSPIDLLLCNAGFAYPLRFTDSSMELARNLMEVNYFGCVRLMMAVLPHMLAAKHGRIVLTSSMVARAPVAGYSLYGPTKAAVRALAHTVDMENSYNGVRVQVVSPPDVATPGIEHENTVKSPECKAISEFGGAKPFPASDMAKAIVAGVEHYRFDITLGSDGAMLSMGSAGIEPACSTAELLIETVAGGVLRLSLAVVSRIHYGIVKRVRTKEATGKGKKAA